MYRGKVGTIVKYLFLQCDMANKGLTKGLCKRKTAVGTVALCTQLDCSSVFLVV